MEVVTSGLTRANLALFCAVNSSRWARTHALAALSLTISALAIGVFSMFLLHDVSRIVNGGETNYIMAATGVYMSLYNIFVNLLNLLLAFGGERD